MPTLTSGSTGLPSVAVAHFKQITPSQLEGVWKPVTLLGKDVSGIAEINHVRPRLTFTHDTARLAWIAYNGCQFENGIVKLGPSGRFSTLDHMTNANGCIGPIPYIATADAVSGAFRVSLTGKSLTFYNKHGDMIGRFEFLKHSNNQTG